MTQNPYEAPKSVLENLSNGVVRFGKSYVFVPAGQDLPPRCVVCNAQATYPKKPKRFYYSQKYSLIVFVLGLVVLFIMGLVEWFFLLAVVCLMVEAFTRFTAQFNIGLCEHHHNIKVRKKLLWASLFLISLGAMCYCSAQQFNTPFVFLLLLGMPVSMLMISLLDSNIKVVKMTNEGTILKGFEQAFLDGLPEKE